VSQNHKLEDDEIKKALVGRTIVSVDIERDDSSWPQGDGDITLILDNGHKVEVASWGYDAWGLDVYFDPPLPARAKREGEGA
jgi:agmatine/peptidylarginine deiminase